MIDRADQAENLAADAKGLASEALSAVRSSERYSDLRFRNLEEKHEELKTLIENVDLKMDAGFASINNKFWSLAIALIFILLGICGWLITYTLNHTTIVVEPAARYGNSTK